MPKLKPPKGALVSHIRIDNQPWQVWEFPFSKVKKVLGGEVGDLCGQIIYDARLIIVNTEYPISVRKWTLDHELAHAVRMQDNSELDSWMWNELETELMVMAKTNVDEFPPNTKEVFVALKAFLISGRDPRERARMLVNWLRERTDDPTQEGPAKPIKLPKSALQRGQWWGRIST